MQRFSGAELAAALLLGAVVGVAAHAVAGRVVYLARGTASERYLPYVGLVALLGAAPIGAILGALAYVLLLGGLPRAAVLRALPLLIATTLLAAIGGQFWGDLAELFVATITFWASCLVVVFKLRHVPPWLLRP